MMGGEFFRRIGHEPRLVAKRKLGIQGRLRDATSCTPSPFNALEPMHVTGGARPEPCSNATYSQVFGSTADRTHNRYAYEQELVTMDGVPQSVIDAAQVGAEWAWARLVLDIDGGLRGYVAMQGGADVDDLVGETWLHVARQIHRFEGNGAAFRSWVFMIAHHRVIDERRRSQRKPVDLAAHADLDRVIPPESSAESEALERLEGDEFRKVLSRLAPAQREVLVLRFVSGFKITEIADIVGKKPGSVQALQRRAFKQLRKILG